MIRGRYGSCVLSALRLGSTVENARCPLLDFNVRVVHEGTVDCLSACISPSVCRRTKDDHGRACLERQIPVTFGCLYLCKVAFEISIALSFANAKLAISDAANVHLQKGLVALLRKDTQLVTKQKTLLGRKAQLVECEKRHMPVILHHQVNHFI